MLLFCVIYSDVFPTITKIDFMIHWVTTSSLKNSILEGLL